MKELTVLIWIALFVVVSGHGRLTVPTTRDMQAGKPIYQMHAPVLPVGGQFTSEHRCRDIPFHGVTTTWTAGETYKTEWFFESAHPGDCFFYLSFDDEKTWMKIAQIRDCHLITSYDLLIPEWVPNGDKVVLRWEWYALQQVVNVEFYLQCADVKIVGGQPGQVRWDPVVTIPGNLPLDASKYRKVYEPNAPFFFTGPAMARPISLKQVNENIGEIKSIDEQKKKVIEHPQTKSKSTLVLSITLGIAALVLVVVIIVSVYYFVGRRIQYTGV
mmetsp:Transcript_25363/g.28215  ORF Transcript_25363/g.28215 Transcript_25363/m.28215 type:complete len:272 (+) Transcript_25363:49-864(+)